MTLSQPERAALERLREAYHDADINNQATAGNEYAGVELPQDCYPDGFNFHDDQELTHLCRGK
jgi:hypothetical protein